MTERRLVRVAGAGIFGLSVALALLQRGLAVQISDPMSVTASASAVAAGLLAPVGEALFDPVAAPHYPVLVACVEYWAEFADALAIKVRRDDLLAPSAYGPAASTLGAKVEVEVDGRWVRIAGDGLIVDPSRALEGLIDKVSALGGRFEPAPVSTGDRPDGSPLVLAVGAGAQGLTALAPELAYLVPVKGQIAVLPHGPREGPVVRWPGGYLAPHPTGARIGATMELGVGDTEVDPVVIAALIDAAREYTPDLDASGAYGQAGVRMQSPDGLPLVGPSRTPGVFLAVGARRNGWLLAPLVAEMIAAYVVGEDPGPWAAMLHPARFG